MVFCVVGTVGLAACSNEAVNTPDETDMTPKMAADKNPDAIPHAQLGSNVIPTAYKIDYRIDPREDGFSGVVHIDVDIEKATQKIWLHGQEMTVTGAAALLENGDSIAMAYSEVPMLEAPSGIAMLELDVPIGPGQITLSIPFETPYNLALNSAYKSIRSNGEQADHYVITQFEAIGARQAFPGFDESRFKIPFSVSITAPTIDTVYANTPVISSEPTDDGWTKHVFAKTRPLPTYLLAFGVGPWDVVEHEDLAPTNIRDRAVPLRGITARGEGENIRYALENTAGILEAMETYFGTPYPYEKIDLIAAPEYAFGAMENPGAIVYTEFLMLMDENSSLGQRRAYARVHSHELAHQWFGNLVTPVWWEDIWLNEAFATWMGNKAIDLWKPEGNFDRLTLNASLGVMATDSLASTRQIREPLLRSENVMDQFDGITYRKGGGVLSMFESYLGEEGFQKGVRLHMERFKDDIASADDFFQSLADGSGDAKVVAAMQSFVDQPGLPLVSAKLDCTGDVHKLEISQSRYAPLGSTIAQGQKWQIPVCARYDSDGSSQKTCSLLSEASSTLVLESQSCPAWITLNADGAGYYRYSMDSAAWAGLLGNLDQLNAREILTVLDSLRASYNAGKMDSDTYLDGLAAFAALKEYDVASRAGGGIGNMYNRLLPVSARPDVARYTRELSAERYERIKDGNDVEANLLAPTLAGRLVNFGGDETLKAKFADAGARYLGLDGPADKTALAANMRSLGLATAFEVRGEAALPALMDLVKTGTPAEKGGAVRAISAAQDPALVARLLDEALNNTDVFTSRQASGLVGGFMGRPAHRDATWEWFKTNFDAFVAARIADVRLGTMPRYAGGFCSLERAAEAEEFFTSKADIIPGYERSLAQTLEAINLCTAFKAAKSEELAAALAAR